MDFSQVKAITIPEGSVNRILSGATVLWKKTGGLPSEYQQVEYIEGTRTQYLNIPYTPVENDEFDVVATVTSSSGYSTLISCGTGGYQFIILLNGSFYKYFASGGAARFTSPAVNTKARYTNKGHIGELVVTNADTDVRISSCSSSYQRAIDGTDKSLYVFRRANGETPLNGRLYKLTIDNGNTEKLNLVPCYRIADGEIGMYDLVSATFFTNSGSGTFIKGADVT